MESRLKQQTSEPEIKVQEGSQGSYNITSRRGHETTNAVEKQ
jgi:hypothetical protein